jgi:ABC-type multidrug transport system ATPase subunit
MICMEPSTLNPNNPMPDAPISDVDADVIVTDRLTKHYGSRRVVDCLTLRVPKGCVYGLLGRNGAGKSTLIKMLLGMIHADSGRAELLGEPCDRLRSETRARIAYMAEGHPLYGWMTIGEAVRFTRPFYPTWNQALIEQILDLNLEDAFIEYTRGPRRSLPLFAMEDPLCTKH